MFEEFVKEITKELEAKESRSRARSAAPHARFEYAVSFLASRAMEELFVVSTEGKLNPPPARDTIPNYHGTETRT